MTIRLRAQDEPVKTRVDYWQHTVESVLAAYDMISVGEDLRSEIRLSRFGPLTVLDFHMTRLEAIRTQALIKKSELPFVKVDLGLRGLGRYEQEDRQNLLRPGEFHLADLRRPMDVAVDESHEVSVAIFPRAALPVRDTDLRDLTAVRFSPAECAYASLVASMGQQVARNLDAYDSDRDAQLGTAFLDLLSVAIARRLDRLDSVPVESRQQVMLARIQAFIERHLGDPGLTPAAIAAAHHISVRTLHVLFRAQDQTVVASIRRQRLERCRRDLLDLRQADRPVSAIGARWGFPDATTFSRTFRAAYGLPPGEYRALYLTSGHTVP